MNNQPYRVFVLIILIAVVLQTQNVNATSLSSLQSTACSIQSTVIEGAISEIETEIEKLSKEAIKGISHTSLGEIEAHHLLNSIPDFHKKNPEKAKELIERFKSLPNLRPNYNSYSLDDVTQDIKSSTAIAYFSWVLKDNGKLLAKGNIDPYLGELPIFATVKEKNENEVILALTDYSHYRRISERRDTIIVRIPLTESADAFNNFEVYVENERNDLDRTYWESAFVLRRNGRPSAEMTMQKFRDYDTGPLDFFRDVEIESDSSKKIKSLRDLIDHLRMASKEIQKSCSSGAKTLQSELSDRLEKAKQSLPKQTIQNITDTINALTGI